MVAPYVGILPTTRLYRSNASQAPELPETHWNYRKEMNLARSPIENNRLISGSQESQPKTEK
jgi:hypothetical protein